MYNLRIHGKHEDILARANAENFKNIFDNVADGILLADMGSKKFYMGNPAICRMLGYSPEEIVNLGVMDIHPEKDLPNVVSQFKKQAEGKIHMAKDIPVRRKDGSVFYADINASVVTVNGKKYLMGYFRDITERKRLEEKLIRSEKMAAVGETVALIAHKINNPLVSILGFTQLLLRKISKKNPQYKDLKKIESAALRCRKTIQSLS